MSHVLVESGHNNDLAEAREMDPYYSQAEAEKL